MAASVCREVGASTEKPMTSLNPDNVPSFAQMRFGARERGKASSWSNSLKNEMQNGGRKNNHVTKPE